jgi:hypothetical protein
MKKIMLVFPLFVLSSMLAAQAVIPTGTVIPVMLDSQIDARSSKSGQPLTAKIMQDVPLNASTKLKAGTRVLGEVLGVTSASGTTPAMIVFRFNRIEANGQTIPISTDLRALASPLDVDQARTQISGDERGSVPPWSQTTTQIGGDVVYREEGNVMRGVEPVGTSVYAGGWGVLSRVSADADDNCRGPVEGNDRAQALWVFSHDACGIYGYEAVIKHSGRANADGRIVLASAAGDLKIRTGSGMLLRVNAADGSRSSNESAAK